MTRKSWKKHHKWFGILFCLFLLLFCISGIVLNHRSAVSSLDISRKYLPSDFHYQNWNNGLLRGTVQLETSNEADSILLYGNAGVFKANNSGEYFRDYNRGFEKGVDNRNIQGVVEVPNGTLFAASQFSLYKAVAGRWEKVDKAPVTRLTDLIVSGDSLIVVGRSELYVSVPPYGSFTSLQLKAPEGYVQEVSLFRTIWLIHSGELFGIVGKILVDIIGIILIVISLTGVLYWLVPKYIKRLKHKKRSTDVSIKVLKGSLNWHDKLGKYTILLTLFVTITGWCLRPPLLLALVAMKVPPVPGSILSSNNPWHDKLRALRYDKQMKEWLLSSSEGFFSLQSLSDIPLKLENTPPVSVMGINVFRYESDTNDWLIGSFSGMYRWNRTSGAIFDYFTNEVPESMSSAPFGKRAISGYSDDFLTSPLVVEYTKGTEVLPMPDSYCSLPISLWSIALEVHTGRIFTILGAGTLVYTTFAGLIVLWILISGYLIRKRKRSP